jgi:hypothetical protein
MMRRSVRRKLGALAVAMSLGISLAHAQVAVVGEKSAADKPSPAQAQDGTSLLAGKLRFTLPVGFKRTALPPDDKLGSGAMYEDSARRQMVLAIESATAAGKRVTEDDGVFLDAALAAHHAELDTPVPNYRRLGTQAFTIKGLGLRRTDGTTTFFDQPVYSTSLIAASGSLVATVLVMTPIKDAKTHQALVANILDGIAAGR